MISTPTTLSEGSDEEYDICLQDFNHNHLHKKVISKKNEQSESADSTRRLDAFINCTKDAEDYSFSD